MSINDFLYSAIIGKEYLDIYGHVNHAHYLTILENARWEYYHQKGIDQQKIIDDQIGPVVLKASITYKKEITENEKVKIISENLGYVHGLWKLRQTILKEDGRVSATVDFLFGLFSLIERKLIDPFGIWLEE